MFMQQLPNPGPGACVAVDECERTSTSAPLNTPAWYIVVFASGEPISSAGVPYRVTVPGVFDAVRNSATASPAAMPTGPDRKSTRLNSSHTVISYAVFGLKKKWQTDSILSCCYEIT